MRDCDATNLVVTQRMLIAPTTAQLRATPQAEPESIVVFKHLIFGEIIGIWRLLALAALLMDSASLQDLAEL